MPSGCDTCFAVWWPSLETSAAVTVRYPHERHGLSGKTSNSAKSDVQSVFFNYVDCNCQPNGRVAKSHSPTRYFISTIHSPKPGVSNYVQRLKRSDEGAFNRAQRAAGRKTCSNGSAYNWLRLYRPKVGICPHKQDYCDTCSKRIFMQSKQHLIEEDKLEMQRLKSSSLLNRRYGSVRHY